MKSGDLIDQLMNLRDQLDALLPAEQEKQARLIEEETNLVLAQVIAALRSRNPVEIMRARQATAEVLEKRLRAA